MSNPWLERRVLAYAHQGGAREGPSSTLYAIEQALHAGAHAIELDVHATADGRIVVCHDATVDRTTNGTGAIADLTLGELLELDNSYWWVPGEQTAHDRAESEYPLRGRAPADRRFGIATLDEVLESFPGVILNLDIKQTAPDVEPYEAALASVLREHGRADDVIVASFNDAATAAFAQVAPEIPTSAGTAATAMFWQAVAQGGEPPAMPHVALQIPVEHLGIPVTTPEIVRAAHRAGLAVHVWTIDDQPEMERILDMGVDGIISDRPSALVSVLETRGEAWDPSAG